MDDEFAGLGPAGQALLGIGGQDMPVGYDEVREAMDAWAHELAEKIRELAREADGPLPTLQEYAKGLHSGADLIDPQVE